MRQFTDKEKGYVKKLIKYKRENKFEKLTTDSLIKSFTNFLCISWDIELERLKIYITCQDSQLNDKREIFFQIVDFITFIKFLVENQYVYLSKTKNDDESLGNMFYDSVKYSYNSSCDKFYQVFNGGNLISTSPQQKMEFQGSIAILFDELSRCVIFPLESLEDLDSNDYMSVEQRNFKKQLDDTSTKHKQSLCLTLLAVAASIIMPFIIMKCSPNTDDQVKILQKAIESTKTEYPTKIEVALPDTVTVKDIENKKTINNIHIHNE